MFAPVIFVKINSALSVKSCISHNFGLIWARRQLGGETSACCDWPPLPLDLLRLMLTDVVLVEDGDARPVEVVDQVPHGLARDVRVRVQVHRAVLGVRLQIQPALDVRDVQRVRQRLDVRANHRVVWAENGRHA